MNLMKWLRKNRNKILAVMVVALMFVFVGGTALRGCLEGRGTGLHETVAHFQDNRQITRYDLEMSRRELNILRLLAADRMLKGMVDPTTRMPDLPAMLLGELLFSDRTMSPMVLGQIKEIMAANRCRISIKQIHDIYRASMPANIYWLLLEKEAELAGIELSNEDTRRFYARRVLPGMGHGMSYAQIMGAIVNRQGIPEDQILSTLGKLRAVLEYAKMICSAENVTTEQLRHEISRAQEAIDAEFVRFDSSMFAEMLAEPTEEEILAHFEKYKKSTAGRISDENPYAFGYKLPDRVQLEYIAVKLDDVSNIVTKPTEQEGHEYYSRNIEQFTVAVQSDPNDPNSMIQEPRGYAEVAGIISSLLLRNKKNAKAEQILEEAKTITEEALDNIDTEPQQLDSEQFRQLAGDYKVAVEQLSKQHKIKLYTGQTGLLSAEGMGKDQHLGRMFVRGFAQAIVGLPQVVFAIDELGASELGPFEVPKPRMYENIGPVRDMAEQLMAIVRVTRAEAASEPQSVDQTFSIASLDLEPAPEPDPNAGQSESDDQPSYSVKERVAEDLKKLAAMETAKSEAEQFKRLAAAQGWEQALDSLNEVYSKLQDDEIDPNLVGPPGPTSWLSEPFRLDKLTNLTRLSTLAASVLGAQTQGKPGGQAFLDSFIRQAALGEKFYSLVPSDSNSVSTLPLVLEFEPEMSFYCMKNISLKRMDRDQYERFKVRQAYAQEITEVQSLAAVHFNPENILTRTRFRLIEEDKPAPDANVPAETQETSL